MLGASKTFACGLWTCGVLAVLVLCAVFAGIAYPVPEPTGRDTTTAKGTPEDRFDDPDAIINRFNAELGRLASGPGIPSPSDLAQQAEANQTYAVAVLPDPGKKLDAETVYARARAGTVIIGAIPKTKKRHPSQPVFASGFVIHKDGLIVSNAHVLEAFRDMKAVGAMTSDGRVFPVKAILAADRLNDAAVLKVEATDLTPLPLARSVPVGTTVYCLSHPLMNYMGTENGFFAFTQGIVSGRYRTRLMGETPINVLTITADYAQGSSGGPILNEHGAVVGRCSRELALLGVSNQHLVLNGIFRALASDDPVAAALECRGRDALSAIPETLTAFPRAGLPLTAHKLLGVAALREFFQADGWAVSDEPRPEHVAAATLPTTLMKVVDEIALPGRGVVLAMGKGGVGKTTVAAAVAVELARRGHRVHLTTTDPAAHLDNAIRESLTGLTVSRIDPETETAAYRAEVMATAGADLDSQGRAILDEDLRSPCTEEIAVFRAFAQAVDAGNDGYVVLDTAPTGHTILLLDAALAYHRELSRQATEMPAAVRELLPRLRDPQFTRVLIVTLPEATPVHEAAKLQQDLVRAGVRPFAWVINQSLAPLAVHDPVLLARKRHETPYIREVTETLAARASIIPWLTEAPTGVKRLRAVLCGRQDAQATGGVTNHSACCQSFNCCNK